MAEEEYGKDFIERRRPSVMVLEPRQAQMLEELHTIVTHKDLGIIPLLKKHDRTLYGNGWPGLKVQTAAIWALVAILGTDSLLVQKLVKLWWK